MCGQSFYCIVHVWSPIVYVCFACGPTLCLGVPSKCLFVLLYEGSYFRVHFLKFGRDLVRVVFLS